MALLLEYKCTPKATLEVHLASNHQSQINMYRQVEDRRMGEAYRNTSEGSSMALE